MGSETGTVSEEFDAVHRGVSVAKHVNGNDRVFGVKGKIVRAGDFCDFSLDDLKGVRDRSTRDERKGDEEGGSGFHGVNKAFHHSNKYYRCGQS